MSCMYVGAWLFASFSWQREIKHCSMSSSKSNRSVLGKFTSEVARIHVPPFTLASVYVWLSRERGCDVVV